MLFDTHFHLDLMENPRLALASIEEQKIYTIAVTNLPELYIDTEKLCEGTKYLRPALGYHPELAAQHQHQLDLLKDLLPRTRYIGEVGLDNQKKAVDDYKVQKRIFSSIIKLCADAKDKILTVHSRKAERDVINIIGDGFPGKVILHWYSGNSKELDIAIRFGFYFSVNLYMTQSLNGKKIIEQLPAERILLESDGPFTSSGNKPCTPLVVSKIAGEILKIKGRDTGPVISANFKSLLM